jgi:hypothetical protein
VKPDPRHFLGVMAGHLMTRTAPALPEAYEQSTVGILGLMLISVGEEFERAASRRVEENRELRRLFAEAAPAVEDAELRARLEAAAAGSDEDLAVSALEASNSVLRGLLIELHAHVEELDSDAARGGEQAIWRELVASTERRRLAMGPF